MNNCSVQSNCTILENINIKKDTGSIPNSLISRSFTKKNILIRGYLARFILNENN